MRISKWSRVYSGNGLHEFSLELRPPAGAQRYLKDFTDDASIISVGSLFQNGTARIDAVFLK